MGLLAVALELRSTEVDGQGMPGRYILHRVGPHTKVDRRKAMIGCLSWRCWIRKGDADTIGIRMVWGKCTTSGECKSIRIAESSVMDGWNGRYLAQCRFWFTKGCFRKVDILTRDTWRVLPELEE